MPQNFWREVQELFAAIADAPASERRQQLAERCGDRSDLRAEVESLLASADAAGQFLEPTGPAAVVATPADDRFLGQVVSGFTLTDRIGQGGMGAVYAAVRTGGDFTQRVAVKLIDLPVRHDDALRRVRSERQILAALNHPHIVTFLDGGLTAAGQAFLVMELIDGVPITRFCEEAEPSLDDRLRLFQRVCGAVQYAHQHSVIHRDLKPANILVTPAGAPKVLDFGIAKLIDTSEAPADATTGPLRALTPGYASPEQLRGLDATTASDIYALGVLLYEIVAGVRPYETLGRPFDAVLRQVVGGEIRRPSVSAQSAAPGRLPYRAQLLRGDLDAIVLKAMRPEAGDRYASAQELSDDIGRYLAGSPVVAHEPSLGVLVAHLARRHRAAFLAASVSTVAILAALAVSVWQTHVARTERRRAEQRFADARRLANAVIFSIHDDILKLAGSTPARRRIVSEALIYLERMSQDPAGDASFKTELARAYYRIGVIQGLPTFPNLGDRDGASRSLAKAIDLLTPLAADMDAPHQAAHWLADIHLDRASLAANAGASEEQRREVQAATQIAEALVAHNGSDVRARRLIANAYFHQARLLPSVDRVAAWQRAGAAYQRLLDQMPGDAGAERNVALVEKYLASTYEARQELAQAVVHYRRALELDERRLAGEPDNPLTRADVGVDLGSLAAVLARTDQLTDAAAAYERSVSVKRRLAEDDPADVLARARLASGLTGLARVYSRQGRHAEATRAAQEGVAASVTLRAIDPFNEIDHLANLTYLGGVQLAAGRKDAACASYRQAAPAAARVVAAGTTANADRLAEVIMALSRHAAACGYESPRRD